CKLETTNTMNQTGFVQQACKYDNECRHQSDSNDRTRYFHPTSILSIGAALTLEKLRSSSEKATPNMRNDAIIIVQRTYDHIDRILDSLNIK
ncbi:unnamed protein product, partial [Rotaria sordida]